VKSAQVLCLEDTTLSTLIKVEIKHAMARRKISLVLEIIQGKATVAEASRRAPKQNYSPRWAKTRNDQDDPPGTNGRDG
jgi:hypothetical protein